MNITLFTRVVGQCLNVLVHHGENFSAQADTDLSIHLDGDAIAIELPEERTIELDMEGPRVWESKPSTEFRDSVDRRLANVDQYEDDADALLEEVSRLIREASWT